MVEVRKRDVFGVEASSLQSHLSKGKELPGANNFEDETRGRSGERPVRLNPDAAKKVIAGLLFILFLVVLVLSGVLLWSRLVNYIVPETATERKDVVNVFVLIVFGIGGLVTAVAALGNFYMSRRNLKQQRELAERQAHDGALQKYLDQISDPETYKDLRRAAETGYLRAGMRAKMKTLLSELDGRRKGILLLFLSEAKLKMWPRVLEHSDH